MAEDMPKWQARIGHIASQGKLVHTDPLIYVGNNVTKVGVADRPHKENGSVLITGFLICKSDGLGEV